MRPPRCRNSPRANFTSFTGLLLSIWDRLPAENMRVYRFETDDRERVIGRLFSPEALARVYRGPGVAGAPALSAKDARRAVYERGAVLNLTGGLQVRRCAVMSTCRVELAGFSDGAVPQLKAHGLISEIIAWRLRLFVPTAEDRGPAIVERPLPPESKRGLARPEALGDAPEIVIAQQGCGAERWVRQSP
jgi:hypothetical protein